MTASLETLESNIDRLARLGLQDQITEMDVGLPHDPQRRLPGPTALEQQAKIYGRVAGACARSAACTAFQTWGFTDRYSWIPAFTRGRQGAALFFDANYRRKPAYTAVLDAFESVKRPPVRSQ